MTSTAEPSVKDEAQTRDDHKMNHGMDHEILEAKSFNISNLLVSTIKLLVACTFLFSAISISLGFFHVNQDVQGRRKLSVNESTIPSFVSSLLNELKERNQLFQETPPEEVKYWFEYTGPLQKYYYRYSKSRGKADSFEGRDDSGVTSARFVDTLGGGSDYESFFREGEMNERLRNNCLSMGAPSRPLMGLGSIWHDWFGQGKEETIMNRCRVLFVMNTAGAGKRTTMLWETQPPAIDTAGAKPWMSEQETAAMHLERNLKEMDAMCASGQIAARVQILVCEPIPGKWTDWMDSMLINCGGKLPTDTHMQESAKEGNAYDDGIDVEGRPSPVQVVVVASADTADTCHDLKSGFMEQRMQDLILALPYIGDETNNKKDFDPSVKTTHPDLLSTDDHDLYVGMKWSSLITMRTVSSFLQSSADIAAAAASPNNIKSSTTKSVTSVNQPGSPFLIPSFVRVSYVSEENNKVAKWRMHGDFFHPAAWEISKDSYEMIWIPDSLSSNQGVSGVCYNKTPDINAASASTFNRRLTDASELDKDCGQWWIYMEEEQMPTNPEIFANQKTPPLVRGGSNAAWMLTESQRKLIVKQRVCEQHGKQDPNFNLNCGLEPHAVIPLGDLESHLVNFMPNTALGKKHESGRRPGYSKGDKLEQDRKKVRERKQLKGQEDIEKALFDYTIYPAALFHKDATLKATRSRDAYLSRNTEMDTPGPKTIMSEYYDVTITKPREPLPSWCQNLARRGLCSLYADYFRESMDKRCWEACGMLKNWKRIPTSS